MASLASNAVETPKSRDNLHVAKQLHTTIAVRTSTHTRTRSIIWPFIPTARTSIAPRTSTSTARMPLPALRPLLPNALHSRRNQAPHLVLRPRSKSASAAAAIPLVLLKPALLQPRRRRQQERSKYAHHGRRVLPHVHGQLAEAEGHEEADELVVLVQVVLRRDVVFPAVGRAGEFQLSGQGDVGVVEGDQPDGEDLGYVEVED
jgi:hypothetical protein